MVGDGIGSGIERSSHFLRDRKMESWRQLNAR